MDDLICFTFSHKNTRIETVHNVQVCKWFRLLVHLISCPLLPLALQAGIVAVSVAGELLGVVVLVAVVIFITFRFILRKAGDNTPGIYWHWQNLCVPGDLGPWKQYIVANIVLALYEPNSVLNPNSNAHPHRRQGCAPVGQHAQRWVWESCRVISLQDHGTTWTKEQIVCRFSLCVIACYCITCNYYCIMLV